MNTLNNGSNLDEIIFENRNKAYGAYFLRKNYKRTLIIAIVFTTGFLTMSVGTPFILTYMSPEVVVTPGGDEPRVIEVMKPPKDEPIQHVDVPKPPPPPNRNQEQQVGFNPTVTDNPENPETPDLPTTDPDLPNGTSFDADTFDITGYVEPPKEIETVDPPTIFKPFELSEQPDFIGGADAMRKFISDKVKYPQDAKDMNIQGTVYVEFIINSKGEVTNVKALRSVDPLLDNEAIRVIKAMPLWSPGKQSGYAVSVSMVLPIAFKLYP